MVKKERQGLLVALVGGLAVSLLLQQARPVGQVLSSSATLASVLGDNRAPQTRLRGQDVTLVAFTDYQCPACRRAHAAMREALLADGRVGIIYKDWPIFGDRSIAAAQAAIAAGYQGRYTAMHDALMQSPRLLDEAGLRFAAARAGVNWTRLEQDRKRNRQAIDQQLQRNAFDAFRLGLQGTPAYLANHGMAEGGLSKREFGRLFARARTTEPDR